ncbi:molybdopterin-binding protein [Streptomyces mirabilis]|uniref:molybdopterin-binding protein n=1 Tax=Streptomyces mirabilis TaxID=68239 RepID=UPI00333101B1
MPDHPVGSLATVVLTTSYDTEVIVVTGSTSFGATDQLRQLLVEHGARWVVDAVAVRPGHPQLLAQRPDRRWIVGLPGNPYAALTAAHTLLAPLLAGPTGRPLPALPRIPLTGDITAAPGRTRLIPVTWDGATARPVGGHRPGVPARRRPRRRTTGLAAPHPGAADPADGMRGTARHCAGLSSTAVIGRGQVLAATAAVTNQVAGR